LPKVRFNLQSQGTLAQDMESADVCGTEGPNAIPLMMEDEFFRQPAQETVGLADIAGVPVSVGGLFAEDVDAGSLEICHPDLVELELIRLLNTAPNNDRRH
jgi:hypothetical protein